MKIKVRLVWTLEVEAANGGPVPDEIRKDVEMAVAGISERLEAVVASTLEKYPDISFGFDPEEEA